MVERRVLERQLLGRCLNEGDLFAEALPGSREHLRALVEPGDAEPSSAELGRDEARSRGHVEHVAAVAGKS